MWRAAAGSRSTAPAAAPCPVRRNPQRNHRRMKEKKQRKSSYRCRKGKRPQLPPGVKDPGGRPRGSLKRFPFAQTPLGFMLLYEAPATYEVLMRLCTARQRAEPPVRIIKAVCAASAEPALCKPKFRRYLERYEREGCCCRRGKCLTPERERYYEELRRTRMENYILGHWDEIERRRAEEE